MTLARNKIELLSLELQRLHHNWHEAYPTASEYEAAMAMSIQCDRWAELLRAAWNTWVGEAMRLLSQKKILDISATFLLVACIFPECVTSWTATTPMEARTAVGTPFPSGELFEWEHLARLWSDNHEFQAAAVAVTDGKDWEPIEQLLGGV